MTTPFRHTRALRDDIRRLAGTMPALDLAKHLGCTPGTLRTLASEMKVSLRTPPREVDIGRPGPEDRMAERIDAMKPRTVQLDGLIISAEVMGKLTLEATARQTSVKALVAKLVSYIAIDGLTNAVLDDGGR